MIRHLDFYPDRGCYQRGMPVRLRLIVDGDGPVSATCRVTHLATEMAVLSTEGMVDGSQNDLSFEWTPPAASPRGYGAEVDLRDESGAVVASESTAFDVLDTWTDHPRYGFLTEFGPDRVDVEATIDELARYHVNGIQFYDWMYRHDDPLPPAELFEDPLGREMSRSTITELVDAAHRGGMAAMAYLAVYGASLELWWEQPGWALYDGRGAAVAFGENFLGIMDPSRGSAWARHLHRRCDEVLDRLPFDGIHIDQYGEPTTGYDIASNPVDLPTAFADFVTDLKKRHPDSATTFNAVKNWPIEALLPTPMDFVYIELWPDTPSYAELASIVADAHTRSGAKPVVIALYLPADHPVNVLVANAVIGANGGSRIEIGEKGRLLTDPYFPLHQAVPGDLGRSVRRQHDFRVRYGELLGLQSAPVTTETRVPEGVWATTRAAGDWTVVNLVNMTGIESATWDNEHAAPETLGQVRVSMPDNGEISEVLSASPDEGNLGLRPVEWSVEDGTLHVVVPRLELWALVAIRAGGVCG